MQVKLAAVLSARQEQTLEQYCIKRVNQWSEHWFGFPAKQCETDFNNRLFAQLPDLADCQCCHNGVALHYQSAATLAVFLLAVPIQEQTLVTHEDDLVQQFSSSVLDDLSSRFLSDDAASGAAVEQEQWQLNLTFFVGDEQLTLRFSARWVHSVLMQLETPDPKMPKPAVITRENALLSERITIAPRIPPVTVPLKQLLELKIGAIIKLPQPIAEPISLFSDNNIVSISGYLVNQLGNKALYLTGRQHEQN
ncbi:FliM/FliN family flagellar motor switch protein [Rheinheimera aquimaris]|jgi:flagellar motor switch/type III secretory pathway protein FliN|uniref:FliM/FliN family flagellar motor switch protein n=1 Tax=Rheinheimera aquimaris TaxID=412437 RepID=UPI001E580394|nr:FliM/FliN family flagellar motor switch protein [Rheinheimera aquimaris]MCD1600349.1 FliM/FliN family flagellar motor switch protein [Rheinheimera aquimaris]